MYHKIGIFNYIASSLPLLLRVDLERDGFHGPFVSLLISPPPPPPPSSSPLSPGGGGGEVEEGGVCICITAGAAPYNYDVVW